MGWTQDAAHMMHHMDQLLDGHTANPEKIQLHAVRHDHEEVAGIFRIIFDAFQYDEAAGNLDVTLGRFVECGCDYLCIHGARHVGHLLRSLIDEQHHEVCLGMVGGNGVGDVLHENGLTRLGLRHDEGTLSIADGREQVNDACA